MIELPAVKGLLITWCVYEVLKLALIVVAKYLWLTPSSDKKQEQSKDQSPSAEPLNSS